ncbi:PucR family transcriptional regulator [Chloroflexia bacterium SDU3-3]|nr:PucR family transcriptional regulator [Chloroflexia bacterium SDU3-3]
MAPVTVRDVVRLALPPGTTIVAGNSGLAHPVTWVASQRATPPVFSNLRGGELALVSVSAALALDDQLTLPSLIERLARVPIAAVGAIGEISEAAQAAAEDAHIPLLHLPDDINPREVEREVQRLISDYEAQLDRRAAQLGNLLTHRSLAGAGLPGLLETLAERVGQAVACYSLSGDIRAIKGRGSSRVALQTLRPTAPGIYQQLGQQIWVQQLGASSDRMGYLAIAGPTLDEWDKLAAQAGAAAIALEIAKEHAVQAAEERLRGDFVQAVLMGPPGDSEALLRRAQDLGYDLRVPHAAVLCSTSGNGALDERTLVRLTSAVNNALSALNMPAPTMRRDDGLLAYIPVPEPGPRARELAEKLRVRLSNDIPTIVVALGKEAANVTVWSRSLREAEQAMILGRQLLDNGRVLDFGDLGVYRLLFLLRESPELWDFYRTTLAALAEYDQKQRAELLKTLEAFFASLGNLAQTAEALHVHRNTLLYRLKRIGEISGLNLEDPEERLALWIALKAHRVMRTLDATPD